MIELDKEKRRGTPVPSKVNVGLMVEVPSIVFQLEEVLKQTDFISIGTNDLAQFTLPVIAAIRAWQNVTMFCLRRFCG